MGNGVMSGNWSNRLLQNRVIFAGTFFGHG
jgi:hypothetical protein